MVSIPTVAISRLYAALRDYEPGHMARLAQARKFVFDPLQLGEPVFSGACDYARELVEHGAFSLPFDCCAFQIGPLDFAEAHPWHGLGQCETIALAWATESRIAARLYRTTERKIDSDAMTLFGPPGGAVPPGVVFDRPIPANVPPDKRAIYEAARLELSRLNASIVWTMILAGVGILSARRGVVVTERPAPRFINAKREAKGKPPLFSYSWVTIDPALARIPGVRLGGTHAPPRLHWRRGHVRRLDGGKLVTVRPCLVGDPRRGYAEHDYRVGADAA